MQLFTFIYSKRSGTPAAKMPDPTTHAEKAARMERLLRTQDEFAFAATRCHGRPDRPRAGGSLQAVRRAPSMAVWTTTWSSSSQAPEDPHRPVGRRPADRLPRGAADRRAGHD